jgi:hypothetical protein
MDIGAAVRKTDSMLRPGAVRDRLAATLKAAFADGLLSEQTLAHRLNDLFEQRLVDPYGLVGDLSLRTARSRRRLPAVAKLAVPAHRRLIAAASETASAPLVLALDWAGGDEDLVIGRGPDCDVVLADRSVSREHARLVCRDGTWVVQDLASTNGTFVNEAPVGRCQLAPGDRLRLGDQTLDVD